jgi:hypothetical protein
LSDPHSLSFQGYYIIPETDRIYKQKRDGPG